MSALRTWHGYLSAFSFLILLFFALTGLILNHPLLFEEKLPPLVQSHFVLTPAETALLKSSPDPGPVMVKIAARHIKLEGRVVNTQVDGTDLLVRLRGVWGSGLIQTDLAAGATDVTVEREPPLALIGGLHRAESAGPVWKAFVDATALLLIAVSVVGFSLFLAMRRRLRTALTLGAVSLILMVGLFVLTVK